LHLSIPHLSSSLFQAELGKDGWGPDDFCSGPAPVGPKWACFGVRVPKTLDRKLKSALECNVWSQCSPVPHRLTVKQTDSAGRTSWQ